MHRHWRTVCNKRTVTCSAIAKEQFTADTKTQTYCDRGDAVSTWSASVSLCCQPGRLPSASFGFLRLQLATGTARVPSAGHTVAQREGKSVGKGGKQAVTKRDRLLWLCRLSGAALHRSNSFDFPSVLLFPPFPFVCSHLSVWSANSSALQTPEDWNGSSRLWIHRDKQDNTNYLKKHCEDKMAVWCKQEHLCPETGLQSPCSLPTQDLKAPAPWGTFPFECSHSFKEPCNVSLQWSLTSSLEKAAAWLTSAGKEERRRGEARPRTCHFLPGNASLILRRVLFSASAHHFQPRSNWLVTSN